jgi:hypothetical protein
MGRETYEFDAARYVDEDATTAYAVPATDGGQVRDLPAEFGDDEERSVVDAFDVLETGDRVLWGDRSVPCVVARVVEPDDHIGQSLTASVIGRDPSSFRDKVEPEHGRDLEKGDVFLTVDAWGTLTGKRFVLIQGPRGGFYALTRDENDPSEAVLFRAVRSYHKTKLGQAGQGAFGYEGGVDDLTIVEAGDAPDELDPAGDLPSYDEIKDRPLLGYDSDYPGTDGGHYVVGTVEEAFNEGLKDAHDRAEAEFRETWEADEEETTEWDEIPPRERVEGTPNGYSHSTVTVTEIRESDYGLKAVLDGPAPWETPDDETPLNEVIKSTPWEEVHYEFNDDLKAWTVDASEIGRLSSVFRDYGYSVLDEADRK